jgi:hypothetical protein
MAAASAPPTLTVSFFNEKTDARPKVRRLPWPELARRLTAHAEREEKDGALWSPASYDVGKDTRRKSEQVRAVSCAVFDYDHGAPPRDHLAALGVTHLIHTTHSHTAEDPRWRVVVPFTRPVPLRGPQGTDWRRFWLRLQAHLAPGAVVDEDCKDACRVYYLPAHRAGAPKHAELVDGPFLDPDAVPPLSPEAEAAAARPAAPVGERIVHPRRHEAIKSLAGTMRRRGMGEEEMAAALLVTNARRCDPPLPEEDVLRIARNYAAYPPGDPVPGVTPAPSQTNGAVTDPDPAVTGVTGVTPPTEKARAGHAVLDDVAAFLSTYVVFPSLEARDAVALWAAHAHAPGAAESTPRLALLSAEKQSGKTRCLETLELLAPGAKHAANLSVAALFRLVADGGLTLLFDEVDVFFGHQAKEHEELRGLLNAGHRKGAVAYRCVGDPSKMEVKAFPAYCPVALAGIGELPDTILDRAILVKMRRRAPGETVTPFRVREASGRGHQLRDDLARWAAAHRTALEDARPAMPEGITDRPADVWEPLLAVADTAGGDWPARARAAAVRLNAERQAADPSLGARLLADIRAVFGARDKLATAALLEALTGIEESPWGALPRSGKPLDATGLARRLKPFDVRPGTVRFGPGAKDTAKGYEAAWFTDAFARYLPPLSPPEEPVTPVTPVTTREEPVTGAEDCDGSPRHTDSVPSHAHQEGCDGVTAVTAFSQNGRHHDGPPPRTRVVNLKLGEPYDVDVSRAGPWGNPFGRPGTRATVIVADDAAAIACYRDWLGGDGRWDDRIPPDRGAFVLNNVAGLAGKTLGCYCAPAGGVGAADLPHVCHGQVLAELADFHAARAGRRETAAARKGSEG